MSQFPDQRPTFSDEIKAHAVASDCAQPMGWTSENVASDFNVSREDMDAFAAMSFQRAEKAQKAGYFDREIVPSKAFVADASGARNTVILSKDDGIRFGTTKEALGKIRAAFPQWGKGATTGLTTSRYFFFAPQTVVRWKRFPGYGWRCCSDAYVKTQSRGTRLNNRLQIHHDCCLR
jgi:acetyl-CoA acyltransferase 1